MPSESNGYGYVRQGVPDHKIYDDENRSANVDAPLERLSDEELTTKAAMLLRELAERQPQFAKANNIMAAMVEQQWKHKNARRYSDNSLASFALEMFGQSQRTYNKLRETFPILPHER